MRKIVLPIRLPSPRNVGIEVPGGARARCVLSSIEQVSGILASSGKQQAVREVLTVVMECDVEVNEDGSIKPPTVVKRNFVITGSAKVVDEISLEYIGSTPSLQTGSLLHVFEFETNDT